MFTDDQKADDKATAREIEGGLAHDVHNLAVYARRILLVVVRQRAALANQYACSMMFEMLHVCWLANAGR